MKKNAKFPSLLLPLNHSHHEAQYTECIVFMFLTGDLNLVDWDCVSVTHEIVDLALFLSRDTSTARNLQSR